MLEDLTIRDFALIDSAHLEFRHGFTVLSGETGAGKSLLIGALTFLLGGKGGADLVRVGSSEASVSGTFFLGEKPIRQKDDDLDEFDAYGWLEKHGIQTEDNRIILRRFVRSSGKSGAWIGSTPVTRSDLAEFCSFLVDIHGQHEHQNLLKNAGHRRYLDSFANLGERVRAFTALFLALSEKRAIFSKMQEDSKNRAERREILSFSIKEISEAKLRVDEDVELSLEEKRLSSFEHLFGEVEVVNENLGSSSEGAVGALKRAMGAAAKASESDGALDSLSQRLENAFYEISDIANEFQDYARSLVFDPARLEEVQNRQTEIYNLKKKYASSPASSVSEVLDYLADAEKKLSELDGYDENRSNLLEEISALEKKVYSEARAISAERKVAAKKMSSEVSAVLSKLGMSSTRFEVSVREKEGTDDTQRVGAYGIDDVEFLISANAGQPLQMLSKIASGGELSRVMLSLKTILASSDSVGTMIFDEVDSGIGGEVAVSVGAHLKALAKTRQVLCITHLASIAVYADNQIKIKKDVFDNSTRTSAVEITGEERVSEIARMLSGDAQTAESLEHARAMLEKFSLGAV